MRARPRPGHTSVPDLVGMDVAEARQVCDDAELVLVGPDPDGPPIGSIVWHGRYLVTAQTPPPGTDALWGDAVAVDFRRDDGGSGDREPRHPVPGSGRAHDAALEAR